MPIDVGKTKTIIETIQSFSAQQLAVMIFIVVVSVVSVFWVENRYAKIAEINQRFQLNEQKLNQAYFLSIELLDLLPEKERDRIDKKLSRSNITTTEQAK